MIEKVIFQGHKGTSFFSRIIRIYQRHKVTHISIWFYDPEHPDGGEVYEALEGKGVRKASASQYKEAREAGRISLYTYKAIHAPTLAQMMKMVRLAEEKLGWPYDYLGVFRFISRRRHKDNKSLFCSEYGAYLSGSVGIPLQNGLPYSQYRPMDIVTSVALEEIVL